MRGRQGRPAAWLLLGCLLLPARARASYEEFSSFHVGRTAEDDEFLLDHELVRSPLEWHDEFARALNAFRSSQGCFTAGQWSMDNELKVEVPMGDTARFVLGYRDVEDMESSYSWTRLDARFPIGRMGLWGFRFSPTPEKSRHDVALLWDHGNALAPLQVQAVFTLEDIFNNFWSNRQVRVGGVAEPYIRHPFEPALGVTWRGKGPFFSARAKWLTPSTKLIDSEDPSLVREEKLWGAKGDGALAMDVGRTTARVDFEEIQASSYATWDSIPGDHHNFNRRWRIEGSLLRRMGENGHIALRYYYQQRTEVWRPPIGNASLDMIDRMVLFENWFRGPWDLGVRWGGMRDRVTVVQKGTLPIWPPDRYIEGTRYEDRLFISLQKLFGRVRLQGIEGIELDNEPYEVSFHHDKGFIQLQTTF